MKNTQIINGLSLTRKMSLQESPSKLNNFSRKQGINAFGPRFRASKVFLLPVIIAMAVLIGFGFTGCDDGKTSCGHKWVWKVTTQAVIGASGLETETCSKCGVKSGKTKTIEKLTNSEDGDKEQLTNGEDGDKEQLTDGEDGDKEQLTNGEDGDKEQLTDGEDGDNEQLTIINISEIKGIFPLGNNTSFIKKIDETDQFTGMARCQFYIINLKTNTFYTVVTITLRAKDGYTLQGVEENFFTVENAPSPAANAANSGVIIVEYRNWHSDTGKIKDDEIISEIDLTIRDPIISDPAISGPTTLNPTTPGPTDINNFIDPDFPRRVMVKEFFINTAEKWEKARQSIITGENDCYYSIYILEDLAVINTKEDDKYTFGSVTDVRIAIRGNGVLSLSGEAGNSGAILRINKNQMVCLHDLTLRGINGNYDALVVVEKDASFIMHNGKITGNINRFGMGSNYDGSGVRNSGTFKMYSGEICNNSAVNNSGNALGGGVLNKGGCFLMYGGTIANNSVSGKFSKGGGIANITGTVQITEGVIHGYDDAQYGNIAPLGAALYQAGGTVEYGYFIAENGEWVKNGNLNSMNTTIRIVDRFLVESYF